MGHGFDHQPHPAPRLKKEKNYISVSPPGLPAWNLHLIDCRAYYSIRSLVWVSHLQCVLYTSKSVDFYKNVPQWKLWQSSDSESFDILYYLFIVFWNEKLLHRHCFKTCFSICHKENPVSSLRFKIEWEISSCYCVNENALSGNTNTVKKTR